MTIEVYRGYGIDFNVYGSGEYSVCYMGDDMCFVSIEEARGFIDRIADMEEGL